MIHRWADKPIGPQGLSVRQTYADETIWVTVFSSLLNQLELNTVLSKQMRF